MQTSTQPGPSPGPSLSEPWPAIWRPIDAGLATVALVLAVVGLGIFVAVFGDPDEDGITMVMAIAAVAQTVVFAAIVLGLARARRLTLSQLGFVRPRRWWLIAVAVLGAYASITGYFALIGLIESFGVDLGIISGSNIVEVRRDDSLLAFALLGLAVVIGAPLSEELIFRGLIFRMLDPTSARVDQRLLAIWVSGFLFGAVHLNLGVLIPFSMVGAVFAYAFRESRSLWTPIAAHAIFNAVSFTATALERF